MTPAASRSPERRSGDERRSGLDARLGKVEGDLASVRGEISGNGELLLAVLGRLDAMEKRVVDREKFDERIMGALRLGAFLGGLIPTVVVVAIEMLRWAQSGHF